MNDQELIDCGAVRRIGFVGHPSLNSPIAKDVLDFFDLYIRIFHKKAHTIVVDTVLDGESELAAYCAEKHGLALCRFTEPLPPKTLGFFARRRAVRARCRRFIEQCECIYTADTWFLHPAFNFWSARRRFVEKCCREKGIRNFWF